jgi:hypothetical protein
MWRELELGIDELAHRFRVARGSGFDSGCEPAHE